MVLNRGPLQWVIPENQVSARQKVHQHLSLSLCIVSVGADVLLYNILYLLDFNAHFFEERFTKI